MRLDRLEVSGGFLDGLQLDLADGLNVVIGARGAGKTSVLELIRFALGIVAMTNEANEDALRQAQAVLGDGTVSLFCTVQGHDLVFTRTGLDEAPAASGAYAYEAPLIVSQSEIEAIGLDPKSRREILDRLIDPLTRSELDAPEGRSVVASLERRLERLRQQSEGLHDQLAKTEGLDSRLRDAEKKQAEEASKAAAIEPLQGSIVQLADQLGQLRSTADAYKIADDALSDWAAELSQSKLSRPIPKLPERDVQTELTDSVARARSLVEQSVNEINRARNLVGEKRKEVVARQSALQAELKREAERLEELQQGAGEVGRRVSALRQQLQERQGLAERIKELEGEIASVLADRDAALDAADAHAEARFSTRKARAAELTKEFNGRIEVRVARSGEYAGYEAALVSVLQGSNLQYKSLAAEVAASMSPRELVTAVEAGDPKPVVRAAGISNDRAVRLIAHLQQQSSAELLLAPLEDSVDFALLDGQEYKTTSNLSMGQRCTVVLPLLLAEAREAILLDQPEDHLDNAFIVETLVEAIRDCTKSGQVIVATHNANIPVLGEASRVIVLASDGRRGFVTTVAPLGDASAVEAITTLMEGGREAFARRAAFYTERNNAA